MSRIVFVVMAMVLVTIIMTMVSIFTDNKLLLMAIVFMAIVTALTIITTALLMTKQ
jgi:ABC-type multidrug transport system permease subunit